MPVGRVVELITDETRSGSLAPCDINGLAAVVRTRLKRKQQQTRCE